MPMVKDAWSTTTTDRNYSAVADAVRRAVDKINQQRSTKSRSGDSSGYSSGASGESYATGLPAQQPVSRSQPLSSALNLGASGESKAAPENEAKTPEYQTFADSLANKSRIGNALEDIDPEKDKDKKGKGDEEQVTYEGNSDNFLPDFNAYSDANLGGMGITDFMVVDPYSDEDREMWRAMTEDDVMGKYYTDILGEYDNDFDAFYNDMIGLTLSEMLANDQYMIDRMGAGEVSHSILNDLAAMDMTPYVVGTDAEIQAIANQMGEDPAMVGDIMYYIYGQNVAGSLAREVAEGNISREEATDILSLGEYNDSQAYGNMQYGYGDEYRTPGTEFDAENFEPDFNLYADDWYEGISKKYTSQPGWGNPQLGNSRAIAYDLYGAGYTPQEGVEDAWLQYLGETEQAVGTEEA